MTLSDVLQLLSPRETLNLEQVSEQGAVKIEAIVYDSRKVKPGTLFVAIKGFKADGHLFIESAVQNGAAVVVCEAIPVQRHAPCVYLKVEDSRKALAKISQSLLRQCQ
jgi:UDP-N-acetylmuramoyl-L-alanyl-D-glutamate--2,6-diaminopimelate ligase